MARNDFETSEERGNPVSLYSFQYGPDPVADVYRYHNGEGNITGIITYDSQEYTAEAITQEDDIESKQKQNENSINLEIPLDNPVASLFKIYPPTQKVIVTIREGHEPNPDDPGDWAVGENYPVAWRGVILETYREAGYAKVVCDATASLNRPGLHKPQQWSCPYTVYEGRCGAVKAASETIATVVSSNSNRVVLAEPWVHASYELSHYLRGRAEWDGPVGRNSRKILRIEGTDTLVLSGPTIDLGATIDLYIGCTKLPDFCLNVHDAIKDFGGYMGIPTFNPSGKNNHT